MSEQASYATIALTLLYLFGALFFALLGMSASASLLQAHQNANATATFYDPVNQTVIGVVNATGAISMLNTGYNVLVWIVGLVAALTLLALIAAILEKMSSYASKQRGDPED